MGAVTVATSMAGRGTDIKPGPGVAELSSCLVQKRMDRVKRIDLQIRGRSGRQGGPGLSNFFVSLEDDDHRSMDLLGVHKVYMTMYCK